MLERLRAALLDLPVVIERAHVTCRAVRVPSYGGARPSSIVTLVGAGRRGEGEHVGWTEADHAAFRETVHRTRLAGGWRLGALAHRLAERGAPPYDRAALEMAAIALALAQRGTTLATLAGTTPRPPRTVVSFARTSDPVAEAARHPGCELKVDVDPAWPADTWDALARTGRVAILDWKGSGDAAAYAHALRAIPTALYEDPAPPLPDAVCARLALDAPLTIAAAIDDATVACNLKPARMGGVLETLDAAIRCARRGIAVYVGGMFEIDVGRSQLRDLAAILSPDGPNDLAPIPLAVGVPTP